jgi:hypothetical protein
MVTVMVVVMTIGGVAGQSDQSMTRVPSGQGFGSLTIGGQSASVARVDPSAAH